MLFSFQNIKQMTLSDADRGGQGDGKEGSKGAAAQLHKYFSTTNQKKAQIILEWAIRPSVKEMNFFPKIIVPLKNFINFRLVDFANSCVCGY